MSKQSNETLQIQEDGHIFIERPINWNKGVDELDAMTWSKLVSQFWVPEAIPLSGDRATWNTMSKEEKDAVTKVFTSLAGLDTLQGSVGALSLIPDARTPHEIAVYTNIAFMERVSGDTQVLTPQGWTLISRLKENQKVLQYDAETGTTSFVVPTNYFSSESETNYEFSTVEGKARQVVSDGHRMYFEHRVGNDWVSECAEAGELISLMESEGDQNFRFRLSAPLSFGVKDSSLSKREEILAHLWAAQAIYRHPEGMGNTPEAILAFSGGFPQWIEELLPQHHVMGTEPLYMCSDTSTEPFAPVVGYLGLDALTNNPTLEWAQAVWEIFKKVNHVEEGQRVSIESKENYDTLAALLTLLGRSLMPINFDIPGDKFPAMVMLPSEEDDTTIPANLVHITPAPAQTMYCVQVPSTYLITRYKGGTVVTGNCIHAKSYSSIAATLIPVDENEAAFNWFAHNESTQYKIRRVTDFYYGQSPLMRKAASTLLESFLFYSGFYLPLWFSNRGKLTNTSDLIKLIMRDEAVHGYYIGAVAQLSYENMSEEEFKSYDAQVRELLHDLFDNEMIFTREIYEPLGQVDEVEAYLKYNANRALMNLGLEPEFTEEEARIAPDIRAAMTGDLNDFFSSKGSSYLIATDSGDEDDDDDW